MHYSTLTCEQAYALIAQGAQLVDVRMPEEHQRNALRGSVNIPLPVILQALKQLDKNTPVLLYCVSGQRSSTAKRVLEACGFSQVYNLGPYTFFNNCEHSQS